MWIDRRRKASRGETIDLKSLAPDWRWKAAVVGLVALLAACSETSATEEEVVEQSALTIAPLDTCDQGHEATGRDYGVREETVIRVEPNESSKPILKPGLAENDKDRPVYATITESTPVREICRNESWSKIRVLVTEQLRWMGGWVPTAALREVPLGKGGRRIYGSNDIDWEYAGGGNRKQILKVVNAIMRDDKRCEAIDDRSLNAEGRGAGAQFTILCVGPAGNHDIQFSAADASNGRSFAMEAVSRRRTAEAPIGKIDAFTACQDAITPQLAQPRTVDYHTSEVTFNSEEGRARVTIGFTSNNGFGNPIDATAECVFEGTSLTSAAIIP